jgi:hypothetical protein
MKTDNAQDNSKNSTEIKKALQNANVVATGRYNTIRSYCKQSSKNLKAVSLKKLTGQTGIYNWGLFETRYGVDVLDYAGRGAYGRIWFKGWCAVPCA